MKEIKKKTSRPSEIGQIDYSGTIVKSVVKLFNMLSIASSQIIILDIRNYLGLGLVI